MSLEGVRILGNLVHPCTIEVSPGRSNRIHQKCVAPSLAYRCPYGRPQRESAKSVRLRVYVSILDRKPPTVVLRTIDDGVQKPQGPPHAGAISRQAGVVSSISFSLEPKENNERREVYIEDLEKR